MVGSHVRWYERRNWFTFKGLVAIEWGTPDIGNGIAEAYQLRWSGMFAGYAASDKLTLGVTQ